MLKAVQDWLMVLLLVGAIVVVGNWVGYDVMPIDAIPGIIILVLISLSGMIIKRILPFNVPSMIYISLVGVILSLPFIPGSEYIVNSVSEINMLSIVTPALAIAGIGIGKNWADFSKLGWKVVIVGICVFTGTYLGSAIIAEIILRFQGVV